MVNQLLRTYASGDNLNAQEAQFNSASKGEDEDASSLYVRLQEIHTECGYIQTGQQLRARIVQS